MHNRTIRHSNQAMFDMSKVRSFISLMGVIEKWAPLSSFKLIRVLNIGYYDGMMHGRPELCPTCAPRKFTSPEVSWYKWKKDQEDSQRNRKSEVLADAGLLQISHFRIAVEQQLATTAGVPPHCI